MTGCAAIGFNSMMADAADEHEALFGTRREDLYFAGLNFAAKAASGLGALVAGIGLDVIGFPTNLAAKSGGGLHVDAHVVRGLGLTVGPGGGRDLRSRHYHLSATGSIAPPTPTSSVTWTSAARHPPRA